MASVARVDANDHLVGFAKALHEGAPILFATEDKVLDIFQFAEQKLWHNKSTRLTSPCSHRAQTSCWALHCQGEWNRLFNRRGVELIQIHRGTLHFRTHGTIPPGDLEQEEDPIFICLYLWLLGQHQCISSVVLPVRFLAPNHEHLFCDLLRLPRNMQRCHVVGDSTTDSSNRLTVLEVLDHLTELAIVGVHLSDAGSEALAVLVKRNTDLRTLIISDVRMEATSWDEFIGNVVAHENLEDFRLKVTIDQERYLVMDGLDEQRSPLMGGLDEERSPVMDGLDEEKSPLMEALSLFGVSHVKRLRLQLDYEALTTLLVGMLGSSAEVELTLDAPLYEREVISALADFVQCNESIRYLKIIVDLTYFDCTRPTAYDLHRIVGKSQLHTLVLSGSRLSLQVWHAIASGLTLTNSLRQLHLDNCKLSCKDALAFFRVAMERPVLEELVLGKLDGTEEEQRFFFMCLVYCKLTQKVTCVLSEAQMETFVKYAHTLYRRKMSKLSLRYVLSNNAEPILQELRYRMESLTSLCLETFQTLSSLGGQFLAQILRNHRDLTILGLHCPTSQNAAIQILKGLAETKSVAVVSIQNWNMNETVQRCFVDMLRQNRSIQRLELYFGDAHEYGAFRESLKKGLECSRTVSVVKSYCGSENDEVYDHEILQRLQRAEMALSWAVDEILKDGRCPEAAAAAAQKLKQRGTTLGVLENEARCSERTAELWHLEDRLTTSPLLDALTSEFGDRLYIELSPEGPANFEEILERVYGDVEAIQSAALLTQ